MRQTIATASKALEHRNAKSLELARNPESHEDDPKQNDEEIKAKWGMLFVTIIIVLSIAFEKGTDYIREATPEELSEASVYFHDGCLYLMGDLDTFDQVVTALLEELTTLGFLGFAFFLATCRFGGQPSIVTQASLMSLHEPDALEASFSARMDRTI